MNSLVNQHYLLIRSILALSIMLSGCSSGYQSGYPYPYSHVNKKPPKSTVVKKTLPPDLRNKPKISPLINGANTRQAIIIKGDTVYGLSRRFDVSVRSIINLNGLHPPYLLKPGQKIKLSKGSIYSVKKGDTVYGVSRNNGILMSELARMNALKSPFALKVGQKLKLPSQSTTSQTNKVLSLVPSKISGQGFMWPLKGKLLSSYGPKQAGYHNDGINIAAPLGSNIHASDSGVVVHASNKLKGYGNLILIKHQNGWVTAYAHAGKILVSKGQQVNRGQIVAKVGRTGRVTHPQLHFEMRKGSRAVNPALYLKG